MKKKRTYNTRLARRHRSYTVQEIAALYGVHTNMVHRWIDDGLVCIDDQKPKRVHGSDLIAFLKARQSNRKHPCQQTEAYCCKCRKAQPFWEGAVDLIIRNERRLNITGLCAICGTTMHKGGSVQKQAEYEKAFDVQTVRREHLVPCGSPPVKCELQGV